MILEGNERGFGAELARHLLNPRDNDHVSVHGVDGFMAEDLFGAFAEAEAISQGTQCQNYLFSLSLNPPVSTDVSVEVFEDTVRRIEAKLGLTGQPRALVFHEKQGRRHAHCVWSRIDAGRMKAITLSSYKRKLMDISRDLYREQGWDMPEGFVDPAKRDPNNHSRQEAGQAKRVKLDAKAQKAMFRRCWEQSDGRAAFAAALWCEGYALARGDRRGFVAVDAEGKIWSLSRWCSVSPKDLRTRLGSEDLLWSLDEAKAALRELEVPSPRVTAVEDDPAFKANLSDLIIRQRTERADLEAIQSKRRTSERRNLQVSGLKALWMRMTGAYQTHLNHCAKAAGTATRRDRGELQALIRRHLRERRALDHQHRHPGALLEALSEGFEPAIQTDPQQRLVLPKDDMPFTRDQLVKDPALILGYISDKEAQFTRTDVAQALAKRIDDPVMLRQTVEIAMASPDLVKLSEDKTPDFTTTDYLAAEALLRHSARSMSKGSGFAVGPTHVRTAIAQQNAEMQRRFGGSLSQEQRDALDHILTDRQQACVVGLAGTGKSTMLKTAHTAWAAQGIKVHGAALAGKAAEGLQTASGISSSTLASLETSWENGYEPIAPGDVLVVDEAGMIGTRQLSRVAAKLHSIGAKLVLIGDPDQLQPIEAGTPFRSLIQEHGAAKLSQIHRQKEAWQRSASRALASAQVQEAVEAYRDQGAVTHCASRDAALAALVEDYLVDMELSGQTQSRLAFAHRRKDVYAINQAIRAALRSTSTENPETHIETDTGPRAFAEGDRIVFTRNDKSLGVKNGMLGTVREIVGGKIVVDLDAEDGRSHKVTFNPSQYPSIDHGYAVTIHKSQGATVDQSYILASKTMDTPLTYVAMTRHREGLQLYINQNDAPRWETKRQTTEMTKLGQKRNGPRR